MDITKILPCIYIPYGSIRLTTQPLHRNGNISAIFGAVLPPGLPRRRRNPPSRETCCDILSRSTSGSAGIFAIWPGLLSALARSTHCTLWRDSTSGQRVVWNTLVSSSGNAAPPPRRGLGGPSPGGYPANSNGEGKKIRHSWPCTPAC